MGAAGLMERHRTTKARKRKMGVQKDWLFRAGDRVSTIQGRPGTVVELRHSGALVRWDDQTRRDTVVWYVNLKLL